MWHVTVAIVENKFTTHLQLAAPVAGFQIHDLDCVLFAKPSILNILSSRSRWAHFSFGNVKMLNGLYNILNRNLKQVISFAFERAD